MVGYLPGGFRGKCCVCDDVFKDFQWGDLKKLSRRELPMSRGVYVLRLVVDESEQPSDLYQRVDAAYAQASELLEKSGWRELNRYFGSRIERINNIDPVKCPVIYIIEQLIINYSSISCSSIPVLWLALKVPSYHRACWGFC